MGEVADIFPEDHVLAHELIDLHLQGVLAIGNLTGYLGLGGQPLCFLEFVDAVSRIH